MKGKLLSAVLLLLPLMSFGQTLCAKVKLEIGQETCLERQRFLIIQPN